MKNPKIVITGAKGFIGSVMASLLKEKNYTNLVLIDKDDRFTFLEDSDIDAVIHLGACTNTEELNYDIHKELNLEYSKKVWEYTAKRQIPLIYASSAATYGNGEYGYDDTHSVLSRLEPLNPYGVSKNEFDRWALSQPQSPPSWTGLKFFNVYGPNEGHKGKMASMVYHAYNQIKETGKVRLFKSYKPGYRDGGQQRDFVYVKDVVNVIYWMLTEMLSSEWKKDGLYNIGTGRTESFLSLAYSVFRALGLEPNIEYIDMPKDIQTKYQYYTKANIVKLFSVGYKKSFMRLEDGIEDYVTNYLELNKSC